MTVTPENIINAFKVQNLPNANYRGNFVNLVVEAFTLAAINNPELNIPSPIQSDSPLDPYQVMAGCDILVDFVRPRQGMSYRDKMLRGGLSAENMTAIVFQVISRELVQTPTDSLITQK